jgi:Holliday junction resolvase RusA-like endonuclease
MQKSNNVAVTQLTSGSVTYQFELPFPPSGNTQARHTKTGVHYLNPKVAAYRATVRQILAGMGLSSLVGFKPLLGPLSLSVVAAPPDNRATDADNRLKCLLDALVFAGLIEDDSNRVLKRLAWEWTPPQRGGAMHLVLTRMDVWA